jgi:hypothetical protein
MPTKPDAASQQEMHDWLKSRGYDLETGTKTAPTAPATPAAGASAAPTAPPPTEHPPPSYDEMDWQQAAGQGVAREGARLGVGAAKLAGQVLPTSVRNTLGQLAGRIPGVSRLQEFADAPAEGNAEYLGQGAVDLAAGAFMPELGLGRLAARAVPATKAIPTMTYVPGAPAWVNPLGAGGRFMATKGAYQAGTKMVQNPKAVSAAKAVGGAVEGAAKNAAAGAAMDPEDPTTGAEYGVGGGAATAAVGKALASRFGQSLGGTLARYLPAGVAFALMHHLGVGNIPAGLGGAAAHGIAHNIRGYKTTVGNYLENVGRGITGRTGRTLGGLAATGAIEGGRVAREGYTPSDASDWYDRNVAPATPGRAPAASPRPHGPYTEEDYANPGPPQNQ